MSDSDRKAPLKPDDNTGVVRAVEEIIGGKLLDTEDEVFADPETERKYREAVAKEQERKEAAKVAR